MKILNLYINRKLIISKTNDWSEIERSLLVVLVNILAEPCLKSFVIAMQKKTPAWESSGLPAQLDKSKFGDGVFQCDHESRAIYIPLSKKCDKFVDCPYGDDEDLDKCLTALTRSYNKRNLTWLIHFFQK